MFTTIGLNHATAPLAIREQVAFAPERVPEALVGLQAATRVEQAAILSTCNRTELYLGGDRIDGQAVLSWLHRFHALGDDLSVYSYRKDDREAVRHVLRVASGLDSMVLGEPEILGQIKTAYQQAQAAGSLGEPMHRLFAHAISVAKQVRSETDIGKRPVSVAFAAVKLAGRVFDQFERRHLLLIGAGQTAELAARHFRKLGLQRMTIANRSPERARKLAQQFDGRAISLAAIEPALAQADIVIASTDAREHLLKRDHFRRATKLRRHKPLFVVDLSVPRNIEPAAGELDDVYLYCVDDLASVIAANREHRATAAQQANLLVDAEADQFMGWLKSRNAEPMITDLRKFAAEQQSLALDRAQKMLNRGDDPEAAMRYLAKHLSDRLLTPGQTALREAASQGDHRLAEAVARLFPLAEDEN